MAEKKTTKAAAAKAAATEKKAPATKAAAPKKCATKKVATVVMNAETVGFKAGDVYQALASAAKALTVKEIAKAAAISETEVLLGAGWLLKEGKINGEGDCFVLA